MPIDLNEHLRKKNRTFNPDENRGEDRNDSEGKGKGGGFGGGGGGGGFQPPFQTPDLFKGMGKKAGFIYALIIAIVLIALTKPFTVINSGEVGIKETAGKFDNIPLQPGLHFFIPVLQKIILVDTKVRIINFSSTEDMGIRGRSEGILSNDAISVLDARGLPVSIEITVQYKLNPLGAPQTIATWGLTWEQKIINPVVRDVVRNVVGRFPAEELPTRRNEIAEMIDTLVRENVDRLDNAPVQLSSIQLREIVLPVKIKEQIERVQVARQEAERTRYEVERARQEAEKQVALAKGEADAKRINAQGLADATLIEAEAQSKANKSIAESLSAKLLELRQIEVQGKFNEALKVNQDAKIFLTPGGSTPNLWLDTKDRQKSSSKGE
jgi:regulator of protease activity HflC (stomatin/prohibitin superfamily)